MTISAPISITYVNYKTFTVAGDYTDELNAGRRLDFYDGTTPLSIRGNVYSSSYSSPNTTVVLTEVSTDLTSSVDGMKGGIQSGPNGSMPTHSHTDETTGGEISFTSSHGELTGLDEDDHTQYILVDGTRGFTGTVSGVEPTDDNHLATKYYVDTYAGVGANDWTFGVETITSGVYSYAVTYDEALTVSGTDYPIVYRIENTTDTYPSSYTSVITDKSLSGFTVEFSSTIDSGNYVLNYVAGDVSGSIALDKYTQAEVDTISGTLQTAIDEKSYRGESVYEIRTLADFNPSGGIITLYDGKYVIKDDINIGTNRFVFDPGATVLFIFDDSFNHIITYTGSDILFSGETAFRCLAGAGTAFRLTGNDATFMDITGSFGMEFGFIEFTGSNGTIGEVRGKVVNQTATAGLLIYNSIIDGWDDGFGVVNAVETNISNTTCTSSTTASGTFLKVEGYSEQVIFDKSYAYLSNTANLLDVDPTIDINANINRVYMSNGGEFFAPATKSGVFTAVADASINDTTITGVSDNGGVPRFGFTGPTVYVCQDVTVSGFTTNTDYNGTWTITDTDGTSYFEIDTLDFGSDETGSFSSDSVTFTEVGTTVANCDSITVDTTLDTIYDIGTYVYNKQANSFQINATYDGAATGTWANGSQTQDSRFVTVRDCGAQAGSGCTCSYYVDDNTATTTAPADTWVDLNLGIVIQGENAVNFKVVDEVTGEVEFVGATPFGGRVVASISLFKSGATKITHKFRLYKSRGVPPFGGPRPSVGLTNFAENIVLVDVIKLERGDRFKIQMQAVGTSTTVTAESLSATIG